jgi:hypothetical protein
MLARGTFSGLTVVAMIATAIRWLGVLNGDIGREPRPRFLSRRRLQRSCGIETYEVNR